MIKCRQKIKYNKYSEPAKSKKLMQVCLKEKCIVLERLRVIAGDIWGKFLPLGYKIMVFVMSHYFNVEKRNNVCELCDFECVCVWLKNKFAVSRKTHETKLNKVSSHNLKVEIQKKSKRISS